MYTEVAVLYQACSVPVCHLKIPPKELRIKPYLNVSATRHYIKRNQNLISNAQTKSLLKRVRSHSQIYNCYYPTSPES